MHIDDIILFGAVVVSAMTVLHAVRTFIATRKEYYDDYIARKRP